MPNPYFKFKQFTIQQDRCAMKVTTDACLFGAWAASGISNWELGLSHSGARTKTGIGKILDIGTGTGLLSLMLAQQTTASIDAIEIDKDAFEQASENIAASPWAHRIKVQQGDARNIEFPALYDVIISNPPFYENELISADTKRNVALHNQGLLWDELTTMIKKWLSPQGRFYLLLPFRRNEEMETLLHTKGLAVSQKIFVLQSVRHDRFRVMIEGMHRQEDQMQASVSEMAILDEKQQYTSDFTALLKDYYLHL